MSDQRGDGDGDEWRRSLPGLSGSDNPLCTPKQIKNLTLDELRRDERLWTAYERGWCDLLQSYMNMQLMQSETSYMLPELARPGQLQDPAGAAASAPGDLPPGASADLPPSASADLPPPGGDAPEAKAGAAAAEATAGAMGSSDDDAGGAPAAARPPVVADVIDNGGLSRRIDVRVLSSRIKRTYKYADVRLCEFQGLGPRAVVQEDAPPKACGRGVDSDLLTDQLSAIRIKITTPEATEFELVDTFDDGDTGDKPDAKDDEPDAGDEKPDAGDE